MRKSFSLLCGQLEEFSVFDEIPEGKSSCDIMCVPSIMISPWGIFD